MDDYRCSHCGATFSNAHDAAHHYCDVRVKHHQQLEQQIIDSEQTKQFVAERNEVLRALDVEKFNAFWSKWGLDVPPGGWADPVEVPMIMMHQTRLSVETMTAEEKAFSKQWLKEHGYGTGRYYIE